MRYEVLVSETYTSLFAGDLGTAKAACRLCQRVSSVQLLHDEMDTYLDADVLLGGLLDMG